MNKVVENNNVVLVGEVTSAPVFSHKVYGEGFYVFGMNVVRSSGTADTLPVMVSDRMCCIDAINVGDLFEVTGQFRSYNKHDGEKARLILSVFATEMFVVEENNNKNQIKLDGYICKEPKYRTTPAGREIADILVAVNRDYGKSDYIPCICWGRNAKFATGFEVSDHVKLQGRIQSREYNKQNSEGELEIKIAYEVSASQIELC